VGLVSVRRETGKEQGVRVPHDEGIANHIDPASCAGAREGVGEALTGDRIGQAIEPRKDLIPGADTFDTVGRQYGRARQRECAKNAIPSTGRC
jgi:hypothetical protein